MKLDLPKRTKRVLRQLPPAQPAPSDGDGAGSDEPRSQA